MKATELRSLSTADLQARLMESHQELFNLRFRAATRQLDNTQRIWQVRKDVARIMTLLREREGAGVA
jgi:large subunit ribosomal protein L29